MAEAQASPAATRLIAELLVYDIERYEKAFGPGEGPLHVHHFWQMDIYLDCLCTVLTEQGRYPCEAAGTAAVIPPLQWHNYELEAGHRRVTFKFTIASGFSGLQMRGIHLATLGGALVSLACGAIGHSPAEGILRRAQALAVADLCVAAALADVPGGRPMPAPGLTLSARIGELLAAIADDPYRPWEVSELAARCHVTPDHFTRCFKTVFEQTPQRFLLEMRMKAAAAEMLAPHPLPIKQVAERAGYCSVHAFTHAFRRVFGVPPAQFRSLQGRY